MYLFSYNHFINSSNTINPYLVSNLAIEHLNMVF